ncbi:hypothetical protein ASPZODRAFT_29091 [Penicilliopsis zonata CBS 506.65]|uniref:HNH nuclease domain-containing protein n=1 Tax=Penicilliopsis zonata CBS 506.65 TaxID=1073090 RepID=A0A1L9S5U0_9EURO|nr:hypothetical protein ASPZODRAFT_29091 [Penicilliopsis zonata CBS 506.65]OJJ42536.1 hypothetical protein ASPZODRAFT_29091 [Penicilliopsis zonata CBS 506.65]
MDSAASSPTGLNAEFEDRERHDLIEILARTMSDAGLPFTQVTWATFWLADLQSLRDIVSTPPSIMRNICTSAGTVYDQIVKPWNTRVRSKATVPSTPASATTTPLVAQPMPEPSPEAQPSTPKRRRIMPETSPSTSSPLRLNTTVAMAYSSPAPKSPRSREAKDQSKARDNGRCIVTKAGHVVEVAHIYPYSLQGQQVRSAHFWVLLSTFWASERIKRWEKDILGPQGTESPVNLVTLAPHTHAYWGNALFALKPVEKSDDGTKMEVQFFWLRPVSSAGPDILLAPPSIPEDLDSSVENVKLLDCQVDKKLCSGDWIVLTTDDPVNRPLPSFNLLEMQWVLHRLTALCGGGDIPSPPSSDDEDGEAEEEVWLEYCDADSECS